MSKFFKKLLCPLMAISVFSAAPFSQIALCTEEDQQQERPLSMFDLAPVLSDAQVQATAKQLYDTALKVWRIAKGEEPQIVDYAREKIAIRCEPDPLTRELDLAHLGNITTLIRKYHASSYNSKPKVLPHAEFEALAQGKLKLYRGLCCRQEGDGTITPANSFAHSLKYGSFYGMYSGGLYFAKDNFDYAAMFARRQLGRADGSQGTGGLVCCAIFDPAKAINIPTIRDLSRIKSAYKAAHPEIFEGIENRESLSALSPERLFLTLGLCGFLDTDTEASVNGNAIASLLGHTAHAIGLDKGTEIEVFDRSALIFDEEDVPVAYEENEPVPNSDDTPVVEIST